MVRGAVLGEPTAASLLIDEFKTRFRVYYPETGEETSPRRPERYVPLLRPEDKPAIWLNKETMDRYRPEMKKYYFDPTKYKTYLEQLGIEYPTVKKSSTQN